MDPQPRRGLGHGVWVVPAYDGGWQVRSEHLHLSWTARSGRTAGSAVIWLDEPYEVVAVSRTASGERWDLRPWPENEVMRGVFRLSAGSVEAVHDDQSQGRKWAAYRWLTVPLLPILGGVPGRFQEAWQADWGFPAVTATLLSAVLELGVGAAGLMHLLAQGLGGGHILPSILSWIGPISPLLFMEGAVRLKHVTAHGQPIGSVAGLPLALFGASDSVPVKPAIPEIRRLDAETGVLELWSPIHRSDWSGDGVLRFRDVPYQLHGLERSGSGWLYRFSAVDQGVAAVPLRIMPPIVRSRQEDPSAPGERPDRSPGVFSTAWVTALACMAPGDVQRRWAGHLHVRPQLLTVVGAGAELVGGLVNLRGSAGTGFLTLLDVFFVVEGGWRFGVLILKGRPVGSLVGLALRPLLEGRMPDGESGS